VAEVNIRFENALFSRREVDAATAGLIISLTFALLLVAAAELMSLLGAAGGALGISAGMEGSMVCVMADCMPPGVPYNMLEERILGSDHSSAFLVRA